MDVLNLRILSYCRNITWRYSINVTPKAGLRSLNSPKRFHFAKPVTLLFVTLVTLGSSHVTRTRVPRCGLAWRQADRPKDRQTDRQCSRPASSRRCRCVLGCLGEEGCLCAATAPRPAPPHGRLIVRDRTPPQNQRTPPLPSPPRTSPAPPGRADSRRTGGVERCSRPVGQLPPDNSGTFQSETDASARRTSLCSLGSAARLIIARIRKQCSVSAVLVAA